MKYIILILFFLSCTIRRPRSEFQILNFGSFEVVVPSEWRRLDVKGIDSYVGKIVTGTGDRVSFDLGWHSNKLTYDYQYYDSLPGIKSKRFDGDTLLSITEGVEQYVYYDTVGGYRAKMVTPKTPGKGITGIYIDSLWQSGSDIDKFNFYGRNFGDKMTKEFFAAIKTLKFHKK